MKFRINWSIQQNQWLPLYKRWSSMSPQERANEFPEGGRLLGRWHDMAGRTGVLIIESNDLAIVHRWLGRWNPYLDVDLTPVVDDEESAAGVAHLPKPYFRTVNAKTTFLYQRVS